MSPLLTSDVRAKRLPPAAQIALTIIGSRSTEPDLHFDFGRSFLRGVILTLGPVPPEDNVNFSGSNFDHADLSGGDFYNARLEFANLRNADLRGSSLAGARLTNAGLNCADLCPGINVSIPAWMTAAVHPSSLSGAYLENATLLGACLSKGDLSGAVFKNADLSGARLDGADLYGADLSGARLDGADLHDARNANLSEAILCHTIMPDGSTQGDNCENPRVGLCPEGIGPGGVAAAPAQ